MVQSSAEKVYRKFVQLKLTSCGLNTRQKLYRCGLCGGDKSIPFHFQRNEVDLDEKITDITTTDIFQEQEVQCLSLQATIQYHFPYSFLASFIYFFSLLGLSSCFCFLQDAICSCNCIPVDAVTEPNTVGDWPSTRAAWCLLVEPLNFIQMPLVPSCSHSYYQRRVHVCVSPSRHICAELDTADTDEENVSFFQRYTQNVSPGHPPPLPLPILLS